MFFEACSVAFSPILDCTIHKYILHFLTKCPASEAEKAAFFLEEYASHF